MAIPFHVFNLSYIYPQNGPNVGKQCIHGAYMGYVSHYQRLAQLSNESLVVVIQLHGAPTLALFDGRLAVPGGDEMSDTC